jgi:hypothetical protein
MSFILIVLSMNLLCEKYIDKADACFVGDSFVDYSTPGLSSRLRDGREIAVLS